MRKRGIEPTVATYGTLVCIASDAQHTSKVKEAWGWLRASGLEVHVTCVNAYLGALIKEVSPTSQWASERCVLQPGLTVSTSRPAAWSPKMFETGVDLSHAT